MKIGEGPFYFFSIQTLRKDIPTGMVRILLPIYKQISEYKEVKYFIGESRGNASFKDIKTVSIIYLLISKCIDLFYRFCYKSYKYRSRFFKEFMFDKFCSYKISSAATIVSTTYLPSTFKKNEQFGGRNIFLPGNPCEVKIRESLRQLEDLYNINISDVYTDKKRLSLVKDNFKFVNDIILWTSVQKSTYMSTYPDKNYFYHDSLIIPSFNYSNDNDYILKNTHFTFFYVAHSVWLKGLTILLDAWRLNGLPNSKLIIGGKIDNGLLNFINLNYSDLNNIDFVDEISHTLLDGFYKKSHVCIVPSLLDTLPATVIESLSVGTPVITTSGCGAANLISEKLGIVIDPCSVSELSEAMNYIYHNYCKFEFSADIVRKKLKSNITSKFDESVTQFLIKG